jgi:hypothetical protein
MTVHRADLAGDYGATIYDVARQLLADGADPDDMVATWRGGVLSMSGIIGELAKWTVRDSPGGTFRLVRYEPFSMRRVRGVAAKSGVPAMVAAA